MKKIVWVLTACVLLASGGDLEDGLSAYDKKDYKKAVALYQKAADQGDVSAQYNLGLMYDKGKGVKQDDFKAADQGYTDAQYSLGVMYDNGEGVRQNSSKAKELCGKACDGGSNLGCKYYAILNKR